MPIHADEQCCAATNGFGLTVDMSNDRVHSLSQMFKALGDPVRLRMLILIANHAGAQACVCDIAPAFDLSQPTISHHLKVLREAGVLASQRRGTWVYYRVVPQALQQLSEILALSDNSSLAASECADE